ncbi:hypothetical protein GPECTOR_5g309 [Gonium pectorale]|uniref:Fungal lipase-type domain-containing protein n=1 Tax=Gonium pectorale TaxID=33097 RepID=A0A150GWE5_GONPE|nr:hypothetical protein GPECTOR_5g309 [Gonium pectorale]|eukprot:KXZ54217.1 hypothetical protein GPECTOR_5g309 [Gonium pectorale]
MRSRSCGAAWLALFVALWLLPAALGASRQPLLSNRGSDLTQPANGSANGVPAVFGNGAWQPAAPGPLNAYVAAVLSKDVYYKHTVDPRDGPHGPLARRNFTLFAAVFCESMRRLGADDCEALNGAQSLVWAWVRAGPSVLVVLRGSNSPQNWITDLASLRTVNVGDFGGGSRGTNVAAGFYQVFAANRRSIVERVRSAMTRAAEAAEALARNGPAATAAEAAGGDDRGGGGSGGGGTAPRLWVLGHSLGGAIALMAATYLDGHESIPVTGVYTFGCPRVGDTTWASAYPLRDVTLRLENTGDIVPTLPFGTAWRHVGSAATITACRTLPPEPPAAAVAESVRDSDPVFERAMIDKGGIQNLDAVGVAEAETALTAAAAGAAAGAGATLVVSTDEQDAERATTLSRRLLRSGKAVGTEAEGSAAEVAAAATTVEEEGEEEEGGAVEPAVSFPFPISIRDHMVQTYVQVMWSCLPEHDQDLVPGPEDVYAPRQL